MEPVSHASRIKQLRMHLQTEEYSPEVLRRCVNGAQRFLDFLDKKSVSIEVANATYIDDFLQCELRARKRHGWKPRDVYLWRRHRSIPIRQLLRLVHGRWPIAPGPATPLEVFQCRIVREYDDWMRELRGLPPLTRSHRTAGARHFLRALGARADRVGLKGLSVRDIDTYVRQRCVGLRRRTISDYTSNLRLFLRHLHAVGYTQSDLSRIVLMPKIYENESIPAALTPEEVDKVLAVARQDLSPIGRRNYAILMLLATYGLRAGEVVAMRLEDIDWRHEVLHVRHAKSGEHAQLPLLREPGEALLRYLKHARPKSTHRQVFLRTCAPIRPFKHVSSLYYLVASRLKAAGVVRRAKRGPHALRHARAVKLLRGAVPLKTIGDVLGHRSVRSTQVYLKLGTEDLRAIGLEVPSGVSP